MSKSSANPEFSGEALRKARETAGLQGRELAARAGCASSTISRLEKGRFSPGDDLLVRLAEVLDIDAQDLLTGEDPGYYPTKVKERPSTYDPDKDKCLCDHALTMHSTHIPARCCTPGCRCLSFRSVYMMMQAKREQRFWDQIGTA